MDLRKYDSTISTIERGETVKLNHDDCAAGTDTRGRLYLTRPQATPNIVLGFCHNCQESGYLKTDNEDYRDFQQAGRASPVPVGPFEVPKGIVWECDQWPNDATVWRLEKRLTIDQCEISGIGYDPTSHRVYLPMWERLKPEPSGLLQGYQLRAIAQGDSPKYYTALLDRDTSPCTIVGQDYNNPMIGVLVEDLASAIVLVGHSQVDIHVTVNYGTKVTPTVLIKNCNIRKGLVWLDNDSEHVKKQAKTIARVWNMLSGKDIEIEEHAQDPKLHTSKVVNSILNEVDNSWTV
jgi:hypothetical protein